MMEAPKMVGSIRHYTVFALLLISFVSGSVRAQPSDQAKARAAALFDQGVRQFAKAQYADAARSFLSADEALPSSQALTNAIDAALRADEPLIVARTANRALARPNVDQDAVQAAHAALAEVTPRLARVDVECEPDTCAIRIDGNASPSGVSYVLPGVHEIMGQAEQHAPFGLEITCSAGSLCRVAMQLVPLSTPAPLSPAPPPADVAPPPAPADEPAGFREHLPMSVFVGSAALTATFGALTIWSGLKANAARDLYDERSAKYDPDEVTRLARRTDIFLGTAIVCAAATAATGLWWVQWGGGQRATLAARPEGGATLVAEGRF
jgi:hypothetical protein